MLLNAIAMFVSVQSTPPKLPQLKVSGANMVDAKGKRVTLRGANLGNWQVIEFWMLGNAGSPGIPPDQFTLEETLTKRFGESEKERLMDVYRSSWITDRDFAYLQKFNFNLVRLPMNYRVMEDDRRPFQLKPNAWKWIDRAIDLAERHGMYVLLDMHGAQGGQNPYDHTGHSGQNKLKDSPTDQKRLCWLWGELAKRYRNRSAVVAYDVMNEPYGTPKDIQVSIFRQAYAEIRKNDPEKLIFAHGNFDDFGHYGDPKANGWHNVGFQMHYYPGLFGGGSPTIKTHLAHFRDLAGVAARVKALDVPFIVGEMNVVFDAAGGAEMMRRYYDVHASYGWMTTMWSYKVMSGSGTQGKPVRDSWGAVTNVDPMPPINFETSSKKEIQAYFAAFAKQRLTPNEALLRTLGDPGYKPKSLDAVQKEIDAKRRLVAPQGELAGWTSADIGGALKGGLALGSGGAFELFGGGKDIWSTSDQFRFLHQARSGDVALEVTVQSVEEIDTYTKSGLMLRGSLDADAPFAMISVFPSGEVEFATRTKAGEAVKGGTNQKGALPNQRVRLVRREGKISGQFQKANGEWVEVGSVPDFLPANVLAGAVALSHNGDELAKIGYRDLVIR
ncbi:MAG: glycoside hydrolase family 5 protein [Fimbriimonas sp.]